MLRKKKNKNNLRNLKDFLYVDSNVDVDSKKTVYVN